MAYKKERLEKIIEREIGQMILFDVKDERIRYATITNVNLTGDLSLATVYFTVFGTPDQIDNSSKALFEAKGFIRSLLSKRLTVRKVPDLIFKYDNSYAEGLKIEKILSDIEYKTNPDEEIDLEKYKEK
ncbi:MAG: 30S ribosome-binding factor RbfA [Bacilli bacterium]|nr:30S ribosome-binding factor RbfA [Bacilli bacterium]